MPTPSTSAVSISFSVSPKPLHTTSPYHLPGTNHPAEGSHNYVIGAIISGVVVLSIVVAIICYLKRRTSQLISRNPSKNHPPVFTVNGSKGSTTEKGKDLKEDYASLAPYRLSVYTNTDSESSVFSYEKEVPVHGRPPPNRESLKCEGNATQSQLHRSRCLAVSQQMESTMCEEPPQIHFFRDDPSRRSKSVGSLVPPNQLFKSGKMTSQDSGFSSSMSIPCSPMTPASSKQFAMSATDLCDVTTFYRHQIAGAIDRFYAIPNRVIGMCYASSVFTIGEFDAQGGILTLEGSDSIELVIPPGALDNTQLIYLMVQFENDTADSQNTSFSPTFECGTDGLQFRVPVELTFPHAAVDAEVTALTRTGDSSSWYQDTSERQPLICNATPDLVTFKLHHFTGFKLSGVDGRTAAGLSRSCCSRIPIRVQRRRSAISQPGKKLAVSIFKYGDKARIYFITNTTSPDLKHFIDEQERCLQFTRDSHWKEFTFLCDKDGLVIEASTLKNQRKTVYRRFAFNDRKVMSTNYESVELISSEECLLLDVTVYQPGDTDNYTQLCVKLQPSPPQSPSNIAVQQVDLAHLQQITEMMKNLQPQNKIPIPSNIYGDKFTFAREDESNIYPPRRSPQEHCEHNGLAACSCWREEPRSPVESDYDVSPGGRDQLKRGGQGRRSKESGYGSCVQSPHSPVSPLRGPNSIPLDDSQLQSSATDHELAIDTICLS